MTAVPSLAMRTISIEGAFVLGKFTDLPNGGAGNLDFTEEELKILSSETHMRSVGDVWIQGHLAIAAVHQILDMGIGINRS